MDVLSDTKLGGRSYWYRARRTFLVMPVDVLDGTEDVLSGIELDRHSRRYRTRWTFSVIPNSVDVLTGTDLGGHSR